MAGSDDDFAVSMIFGDPSPNGHINQRINNAFCPNLDKVDLTQDEKNVFIDRLLQLSKKLAMTWRHLDKYRSIEGGLVAKVTASPLRIDGKRVGFGLSDELQGELDGFLVQLKSSLDYLAQVPGPVFGRGWTPRTFGDKGDKIIAMLERNAGARFQDRIPTVVQIIRANQPWLEEVISVRDKINHFQGGGVPYELFKVSKVARDGEDVVLVPMWNESETVRDALGDIWRKLMCLCEMFVGFTLYLRLEPHWGVRYTHIEDEGETEADEEADSPRWEFDLDLESIGRDDTEKNPASS